MLELSGSLPAMLAIIVGLIVIKLDSVMECLKKLVGGQNLQQPHMTASVGLCLIGCLSTAMIIWRLARPKDIILKQETTSFENA